MLLHFYNIIITSHIIKLSKHRFHPKDSGKLAYQNSIKTCVRKTKTTIIICTICSLFRTHTDTHNTHTNVCENRRLLYLTNFYHRSTRRTCAATFINLNGLLNIKKQTSEIKKPLPNMYDKLYYYSVIIIIIVTADDDKTVVNNNTYNVVRSSTAYTVNVTCRRPQWLQTISNGIINFIIILYYYYCYYDITTTTTTSLIICNETKTK